MPIRKKGLFKVRCSVCKVVIGYDESKRALEFCLDCYLTQKKEDGKGKRSRKRGGYVSAKQGVALDLPPPNNAIIFRSTWERNFARVLTLEGRDWTYERLVFTFPTAKRKPRSYIPDFYVAETDTIWEIKGYLSPMDRVKIKRFKSNYPEEAGKLKICLSRSNEAAITFCKSIDIKIVFIEDLKKAFSSLIPTWE